MSAPAQPPRLYFAYGSNLSPTQMSQRCPSSTAVGLARLPGWTFIINGRRYANVVPSAPSDFTAAAAAASGGPGVYGVLYTLPPSDEAKLDRYEGVPVAYEKEVHPVEVVSVVDGADLQKDASVQALVYVDRERTAPAEPWPEYVDRMNRGAAEAAALGLPGWYVDEALRKWIPAPEGPVDPAAIEDPFQKDA